MQTNGQTNPPAPQTGGRAVARPRPVAPAELRAAQFEKLDQPALIAILKERGSDPATIFKKGIACKRLAVTGTAEAVPPLAALLSDDRLSDYARDALESIPSPAVDDALRAALPRLRGLLLVGAINSIGRRRDAKTVDPLARMLADADPLVVKAAATALGEIGGPAAAKALQDALGKAKGAARADLANGLLVCGDRMMMSDRRAALTIYDFLLRPDIPAGTRASAMHLQILAETSLKRPRVTPTAPAPPPQK